MRVRWVVDIGVAEQLLDVLQARLSHHRANVPPGRCAATLGSSNGSGIMRPRSTRRGVANHGTLTIACTQAFGLAMPRKVPPATENVLEAAVGSERGGAVAMW